MCWVKNDPETEQWQCTFRSAVARASGYSDSQFTDEAQIALFKDPVRTAQYTLFISVIKTNLFML